MDQNQDQERLNVFGSVVGTREVINHILDRVEKLEEIVAEKPKSPEALNFKAMWHLELNARYDLWGKYQELARSVEQLRHERDEARGLRDVAQRDRAYARVERDGALRLRDRAEQDRDLARQQRDEAARKRIQERVLFERLATKYGARDAEDLRDFLDRLGRERDEERDKRKAAEFRLAEVMRVVLDYLICGCGSWGCLHYWAMHETVYEKREGKRETTDNGEPGEDQKRGPEELPKPSMGGGARGGAHGVGGPRSPGPGGPPGVGSPPGGGTE